MTCPPSVTELPGSQQQPFRTFPSAGRDPPKTWPGLNCVPQKDALNPSMNGGKTM